ncbi:DEKNAAC102062 [Brettanomyces naardenensis]|uniref:DEKNAAC102062 n=1 Tax=Brettanomyces naardenensis TaxID=13370 RepID=A0A448YJJ5_BRENA|nr:DEKNAAC102062 [Brettanomyces naardenensis]
MDLNYPNLVITLTTAAGVQRGIQQESAEAQLKQWEVSKGYHYLLQQVYNDMSQTLQVRWLAVICMKNGVDKYWRPTRMHAISKEEKQEIRKGIFNRLDESNNQLTIQNAHIIARICRHDFPVEWPTIFDEMADIMESSSRISEDLSVVRINNLLIIMNQVLKVLASVRIGRARIAMQSKMPIILPHLVKYYHHYFRLWTTGYDLATMEVGYMCLKNIRRAVVDGYEYPHRDATICEFFETSLAHFQKLFIMHQSTGMELLEKYLKCYLKLYFNMASANTVAFLLFSSSKNIVLTLLSMLQQEASTVYNLEERDGSDFWEQMAVKAILIMKKITSFAYRKGATVLRQRNDKQEVEKATKIVVNDIFSEQLLDNLVNMLMSSYLKLRPCDLEAWQLEPEEWVTEELQVSWEYQIRPCAENYFQDLASYFKPHLCGFIMDKIQSTLSNPDTDVVSKDAILSVFQLSSSAISDGCNFDEMFPNYFLPEALKDDSNDSKIIRRRVCLIISEWVCIQCSKETRDAIYNLMATLMQPGQPSSDKVVRLTASQTLQHLVDDWEFRKADFRPYLDNIVESLLSLLKELGWTESKMFILKVMSLIIERSNPLLDEHVLRDIMDMVPKMWEESNDSNEMILKNSLLRVLRDLTNSLNSESQLIHPMVIPLIPLCCTEGSQYYSLLCEDGFELWSAVLKQLPLDKPIPVDIFEQWFPLILTGLCNWTEILPLVLNIVRSYTLVNAGLFESDYGLEIFKVLGGYLGTMRDDSLFATSQLVEILLLQIDREDDSKLTANIADSGLFNAMVSYITRETETPNCEIKMAFPILRMIILDPKFFIFQLLNSILVKGTSLPILFNRLVTNLIGYMKLIYDSKARKLFLLGLLSFYDADYFVKKVNLDPSARGDVEYQLENLSDSDGIALVLSMNFNKILSLTSRFLEEVQENDQGDCKNYHRQSPYDDEGLLLAQTDDEQRDEGEDPDNEYVREFRVPESGERLRYTRLILAKDSIFNVNLKEFVKFKMSQLVGSVENYEGLINTVNRETLDDLQLAYSK